ncbi:MAG TPA: 1-(5-phosphoribosyl)-5-[(5-phosphoribosylamino)methylideneamino]imidazole-4-carboxamide isomerase [Planctomycetaceae bacterium]|nr:1-(5-phosphoribosyl)-5-[(5-phosphoribosylamino)methylideneamino]imidazole-4-carboxamide isomerase [Planctomycetaceae bacterium]
MEIIPAIDLRGGLCVRLTQGDYAQETMFGDDPPAMARRWEYEGAARLHLVDLDGARTGRPVNIEAVRAIVEEVNIPCQLGGGIRDEAAVRLMLSELGIERVIVGTQALKAPDWFCEMAEKFPQRLVLGIDARDSMVATEGWLNVSQTPAFDLAQSFVDAPIAALIYTNIANDGMLAGVDQGTIDDLVRLSDLGFRVIASGGVTTVADVANLAAASRKHPNLVGAIVGRAFYEGTLTFADAQEAANRAADA